MKKRLVIIILLLAVAAAGGWVFKSRLRGSQQSELRLYGNVDIREVNLGFRVPGKLAEVLRDEGDPVHEGDILARLDDQPYLLEVDQARAQAGVAAARLELLQAGYRTQEVAQATAVLKEREVTFANAERVYQRLERLLAEKTVSQQERDDAEARFREAEARLKSARQQLALLESGFRPEEIQQAKAELERARANLGAAELRLRDAVLTAPAEGVVLTRAQEPGAILQTGNTVLSLSLRKPVWVRAYVDEPRLGKVHPGMPVKVTTDTAGAKVYKGQVGYISPRAEFTPKSVETPELRTSLVYRLRIVVSDPDEALRQGMPVTVEPAGE